MQNTALIYSNKNHGLQEKALIIAKDFSKTFFAVD